MNKHWRDNMRRKLEGHQMTPPPGLWEGINEQMGLPLGHKPLSRPTGTARRYWAAAAVAVALVGFFVFYQQESNEPRQIASNTPRPSVKTNKVDRPPVVNSVQMQPAKTGEESFEEKDLEKKVPEENVSEEVPIVTQEPDAPMEETDRQVKEPTKSISSYPTPEYEPRHHPAASSKKWSVGMNASGGLLAANHSTQTDRLYYGIGNYEPLAQLENKSYSSTTSPYTYTDIVAKHRLPVRFGLSVQYQLTNHLALLSGISYTYLSSEFSIPLYDNISYSQKLHYIGIPLGMVWQLWSSRYFRFYLSGGTMVEKCVSAQIGENSAVKKPWQWSVNAAAGAEYSFTRQLGFYLEPSVGYYFDDGTALEHYYKDHPLAPSIEFGLRLHLAE